MAADRDDPAEDDELAAFVAEQRRRHQRFVAAVLAGSLLLLAAGVVCLVIAQNEEKLGYAAGGALLTGLGGLGLIRGLISLFTDIDTRDRGEWDMVVGNEPDGQTQDESDHE